MSVYREQAFLKGTLNMRVEKIGPGKYLVHAIQDNGIERQPATIEKMKRGQRKWAVRKTNGIQGVECRRKTFAQAKEAMKAILPFWNM